MTGEPAGWAGGIVHFIATTRTFMYNKPITGSELAKAFGVTMSTIEKRAARVRIELDTLPLLTEENIAWMEARSQIAEHEFRQKYRLSKPPRKK